MDKYILKSVFFKKLKGLNDIKIEFSNTLTAIMGVNGSGKTTVIHALACLYQPDGNGENHKFPEFFVPNTDSLWKGSELHVVNETVNGNTHEVLPSRQYGKGFDRWTPKYQTRPFRNVYYIGIDSCLPDIEKKTPMSRINYKTRELSDRVSRKAIEKSAYILNKNYEQLLDNTFYNKHLLGVKLKDGLKYSSLSMGSGEQRVIKIINVLLRAEAYSLILIDEIDLLLHVSALRRLIETIYDIKRIITGSDAVSIMLKAEPSETERNSTLSHCAVLLSLRTVWILFLISIIIARPLIYIYLYYNTKYYIYMH